MEQSLSLLELNLLVKEVIQYEMADSYWVRAEIGDISERGGHCYMSLIEKDEQLRTPVAQARACCWRNVWAMVRPMFERVTGKTLRQGMKVLLQVQASFHPAYGFSWIVTGINPEYTLGDLARRRQEIIRQLKEEGIYDAQHDLNIPLFTQRIAVVSSASAAGYGDFCHQLQHNNHGFYFKTTLFSATMQGEDVEESVIHALCDIYERMDEFDVVVIIRGGGATSDLTGFDTLPLAEHVANFPLPILTGIGHQRDESVLDLIACRSLKTPTAVAAFLIEQLTEVEALIHRYSNSLQAIAQNFATRNKSHIDLLQRRLLNVLQLRMSHEHNRIGWLQNQLSVWTNAQINGKKQTLGHTEQRLYGLFIHVTEKQHLLLNNLEQRAKSLDPTLLLQRGYSITLLHGHAITNATQLQPGDNIEIRFAKGKAEAEITDIKHQST